MNEPATVAHVFVWLLHHPGEAFFRRWNYKSAVLSSLVRGSLFFVVNLGAGPEAATAAMLTEWGFRACTSGFYGALTQAFRRAEPKWLAMLCVLLLLPAVSHGLELAVHWWRGTPELVTSIAASVLLTVVSTGFNLFAMRRGVLVVGDGGRPILEDLRRMPELIVAFITFLTHSCARACR
jgi:hypothetical protein